MFQSNVNLIAPLYDALVLCNCMENSDTGRCTCKTTGVKIVIYCHMKVVEEICENNQ